jgi:hypothetical protein
VGSSGVDALTGTRCPNAHKFSCFLATQFGSAQIQFDSFGCFRERSLICAQTACQSSLVSGEELLHPGVRMSIRGRRDLSCTISTAVNRLWVRGSGPDFRLGSRMLQNPMACFVRAYLLDVSSFQGTRSVHRLRRVGPAVLQRAARRVRTSQDLRFGAYCGCIPIL